MFSKVGKISATESKKYTQLDMYKEISEVQKSVCCGTSQTKTTKTISTVNSKRLSPAQLVPITQD